MNRSFRLLAILILTLALSAWAQTGSTVVKKKHSRPATPAASQQDVQALRELVQAQQKQIEAQNQQLQEVQGQLRQVLDSVQQANANAQKLQAGAEQAQATATQAQQAAQQAQQTATQASSTSTEVKAVLAKNDQSTTKLRSCRASRLTSGRSGPSTSAVTSACAMNPSSAARPTSRKCETGSVFACA